MATTAENPLATDAKMLQSYLGGKWQAGAERVFEIIDTPSEVDDAPDAVPLEAIRGDVRFDHVNFEYQRGTPIIKEMTLGANAGEIVALVGPTGAGKTTIINLLSRFYEIDSGEITIDGTDIRTIKKPICAADSASYCRIPFCFPRA